MGLSPAGMQRLLRWADWRNAWSALERENRELRRADQILKSAASFFAAELDRPWR